MAIRFPRSTGKPRRADRCSSAGISRNNAINPSCSCWTPAAGCARMDGGVPQFDHILNAILLVAHVALRQGDQVAVKSFGGTDRWLPPMKGSHAMPVLLNHLYDYQTTPAPSDFAEAVEKLMARQRRRSLVILLTNLRGEDGKELLPALQALKSRHLVLLASMREGVVQEAISEPIGIVRRRTALSRRGPLCAGTPRNPRQPRRIRSPYAGLHRQGIPGSARQLLFRHQGGGSPLTGTRSRNGNTADLWHLRFRKG